MDKEDLENIKSGSLIAKDKEDSTYLAVDSEYVLLESKESDAIETIENFIEDIYNLRKTSIAKEGEYSIGNLVFKKMRNEGYLDNLKRLRNCLKSKELSLYKK